jgi:hypothetical protein
MARTKKLFAAVALLGVTLIPVWTPQAEAVASCTDRYCITQPSYAPCACPADSLHPYQRVTCGSSYSCYF